MGALDDLQKAISDAVAEEKQAGDLILRLEANVFPVPNVTPSNTFPTPNTSSNTFPTPNTSGNTFPTP